MAYIAFADSKPVASDTGLVVVDDTRNNLMAMRDAVIAGTMAGWNYAPTVGTGTAEQPQYVQWSKGTERVRGTITWGTTGGSAGNATQIVWEYSSNSGTDWDTIGTEAVAYDADGNPTSTTWS